MSSLLGHRRWLRVLAVSAVATVLAATLLTLRPTRAHDRGAINASFSSLISSTSKKDFAVKLANTDFGVDAAKGHFSATLSRAASVAANLAAAITGVPFAQIAQGGTYLAKVHSGGGMAMVTFAHRSLGTACVKFTAHAGKYNPALGYVPVTGAMTIVGGTRAAARWTGTIKFKQTGITGTDTLDFAGSSVGSTRKAHGLTAACRAVAKLKG